MHEQRYHGYTIALRPAQGGVQLSITTPAGAQDAILVAGPPDAAISRARRTIDALIDPHPAGCCACGRRPICSDARGVLRCLPCAIAHYEELL